MNRRYAIFTNDVETHSLWFNDLRDETGKKIFLESMPSLLELYDKYEVKGTFFYTGYIAKLYPNLVKMVHQKGHEIGCHGLTHEQKFAFDRMDLENQKNHLIEAKKILEDLTGEEVISFRAPFLRVNKYTPVALAESGFVIDSSIASQRFDFFFSFGSFKKIKSLIAPRLPYKTAVDDLYKKGSGSIIEVPVSAIFLPYIGTILRVLPSLNNLLRFLLLNESKFNKKPLVFYSHPAEFLDESIEYSSVGKINRRVNSQVEYMIRDVIKTKMKRKNLGKKALNLIDSELSIIQSKGFTVTTIKDYCEKTGLLK